MFTSVYNKPSLFFNAHGVILCVHIHMNVNTLYQKVLFPAVLTCTDITIQQQVLFATLATADVLSVYSCLADTSTYGGNYTVHNGMESGSGGDVELTVLGCRVDIIIRNKL